MRPSHVGLTLIALASCTVDVRDLAGRPCNDEHPCSGDRQCLAGVCIPAASLEDGGTLPQDRPDSGTSSGCGADGGACSRGLGECARVGTWICSGAAVVC